MQIVTENLKTKGKIEPGFRLCSQVNGDGKWSSWKNRNLLTSDF